MLLNCLTNDVVVLLLDHYGKVNALLCGVFFKYMLNQTGKLLLCKVFFVLFLVVEVKFDSYI